MPHNVAVDGAAQVLYGRGIVRPRTREQLQEDEGEGCNPMSYARYARNRRRNERYRARYDYEKQHPTTPAQKAVALVVVAVIAIIAIIAAISSAVAGGGNGCETNHLTGEITCNGKTTAFEGDNGQIIPIARVNRWYATHQPWQTPPWDFTPSQIEQGKQPAYSS